MHIAYHGTSTALLDAIRLHGLIPDPPRRSWAEDPGAGVTTPSRVSLPGVYLARNLLTATSASLRTAQKFGGRDLIVAVAFDPEQIVPDEDSIKGPIARAVSNFLRDRGSFMIHQDYYSDVLGYLEALEAYTEVDGVIGAAAARRLNEFLSAFVEHAHKAIARDPANEDYEPPVDADLWVDLLRTHIERRVAYHTIPARMEQHRWHPPSAYYHRSNYAQGIDVAAYQILEGIRRQVLLDEDMPWDQGQAIVAAVADEIHGIQRELEKSVWDERFWPPTPARMEARYSALLDRITRRYRHWAHRELAFGVLGAFRLLVPVGYHGPNRIVALIELSRYSDGNPLRVYYGTPPEDFVDQYARFIAPKFTVVHAGFPHR